MWFVQSNFIRSTLSHSFRNYRSFCAVAEKFDKNRFCINSLGYDQDSNSSQLELFKLPSIRNFCIIAHIDHGKSTLADALLVRLGNITEEQRRGQQQQLDTLMVERERGITVKAQTASMLYEGKYLLNLIDTPGHADFSYEVIRSLSSSQGALLLVDASQGIQAQTLSTYRAAEEAGLKLLPVVTKIDLPNAQVVDTILSIATTFNMDPDEVLATSAKSGEGIDAVIRAIVKRIPAPPPEYDINKQLRARILDNWYDPLRGIVSLVQCVDGVLCENERITTCHLMKKSETGIPDSPGELSFMVQEVGILRPKSLRTKFLYPGQVGYMISGIKSVHQVLLGDTIIHVPKRDSSIESSPKALALFSPCRPNLFASCFPMDGDDFVALLNAVEKLALNDASLQVHRENSTVLGNGLRIGFLGLLHMEVFKQRLSNEFNMSVLITAPNVAYTFRDKKTNSDTEIFNLADWSSSSVQYKKKDGFLVLEPMVEASIIIPSECLGAMITLLKDKRGTEQDTRYIDQGRVLLTYKLPWQEVVTDLHDKAKSVSSGYATINYRPIPPEAADLVLCEIAINGDVVEALSFVSHRSNVMRRGRDLTQRLKEVIPRQQFEVAIQALIGSKPFAREQIRPYRKDVLTKAGKTVGGGDPSRKKKLLEKQKEGKKKAKSIGKIQLPQSAFWALISKR